ncbi:hypothetical protein GGF31_004450 [Allomyces arbusculus]|nr:hypothetical protein GGF31_004450 [Allomyces arbusculus]
MNTPPISSTSDGTTDLLANVSGALQHVIQALTKITAANAASSQHQARLTRLRDLTNRAHDHVYSFYSHDQELVNIVDSLVGVSTALVSTAFATLIDGPATSVSSYSPVPVANPSTVPPLPPETPVSRPQEGPGPAPALATARRGSGMMSPPSQAPPLRDPQWGHPIRSWTRGPMSDTASEYSTMSSVRYISGSDSVSTPSVSSSKLWTPPSAVEGDSVQWPEEFNIANCLALEKTGVVLPMRSDGNDLYVAAGVLGFLTGTYSSLRSANNTISRHVRDYGHSKDGKAHEGIRKFSERWYITIEAFKEHIAPHIRGYKDIWAKKG